VYNAASCVWREVRAGSFFSYVFCLYRSTLFVRFLLLNLDLVNTPVRDIPASYQKLCTKNYQLNAGNSQP
jgi:hypothetical protein